MVLSEASSRFFLRKLLWRRAADTFHISGNNKCGSLRINIAVTLTSCHVTISESMINNCGIMGIQSTLKRVFIFSMLVGKNVNTMI